MSIMPDVTRAAATASAPGQDIVPRQEVTVEFLDPSDLIIADVRTREPVAGPFPDVEAARAAWANLPDGGFMCIMTAGWLIHLASTPRSCQSLPLPDVA